MGEQENYNLNKKNLKRIVEIAENRKEVETINDFMAKIVNFSELIMDDSFVIQHQTIGQYRSALMKNFRDNFFAHYREKLKKLSEK